MKKIILAIVTLFTFSAFASDSYSNCSDESGQYEYDPENQELVYNLNEVYLKNTYLVHFSGLVSATKGSCVATDGKTYEYENTQYSLKVTYLNGNSGAEDFLCEKGYDALPAGLKCVNE